MQIYARAVVARELFTGAPQNKSDIRGCKTNSDLYTFMVKHFTLWKIFKNVFFSLYSMCSNFYLVRVSETFSIWIVSKHSRSAIRQMFLNSNVITGMDMSIILKVALLSFPVLYVYKRSVLQTCLFHQKKAVIWIKSFTLCICVLNTEN